MNILERVRRVRGKPVRGLDETDDEEEVSEVTVFKVMGKGRLREVMESARWNAIWYWIECPLCLRRAVFEDEEERKIFRRQGYCGCGYRYDYGMKNGEFPGGKVLVWDNEEVVG